MTPHVFIMIPARHGSERFPGKIITSLLGRPLLSWVIQGVKSSKHSNQVVVATDHPEISKVASEYGAKVIETSANCSTGTDRLAEAIEKFDEPVSDDCIVVNIQGDEPLISGKIVDLALAPVLSGEFEMSTLACRLENLEELQDKNVVKVLMDERKRAVTFSRFPIPFSRTEATLDDLKNGNVFRHIGVYVYRACWLRKFSKIDMGFMEKHEKLEQLRALENGVEIAVVETEYRSVGVDVPENIPEVEKLLQKMQENS